MCVAEQALGAEKYGSDGKFLKEDCSDRELGVMKGTELLQFNAAWESFWQNTILAWRLDLSRKSDMMTFYDRVDSMANILLSVTLGLLLTSGRDFVTHLVIASVGYCTAAFTFGVAHMVLHARVLDYHWSGSLTAFYCFAYLHHRTPAPHNVFGGQLLIMILPSVRPSGWMVYEMVKYGMLLVLLCASSDTQLVFGWWFLSWIMEAAAHSHAHQYGKHGRRLPLLVGLVMDYAYVPLGLVPTHESHKLHHDLSQPTRFSNFTDLALPLCDTMLNAIWDRVYQDHSVSGTMYETLNPSDSSITRWLSICGFGAGWVICGAAGVDATLFYIWMTFFTHLVLHRLVRKPIEKLLKNTHM
jgi:hypothetical protein